MARLPLGQGPGRNPDGPSGPDGSQVAASDQLVDVAAGETESRGCLGHCEQGRHDLGRFAFGAAARYQHPCPEHGAYPLEFPEDRSKISW
jgi:hypothetical protein